MTIEDVLRSLPVVAFLVLQGIRDVLGEDCGNNLHCNPPYVCCTNHHTCCYDSQSQDNFRRAYKLHVWNMWYFWFVIIFILMSCFGGCGYYRRRRMAAIENHRQTAITTWGNPRTRRANRASYLAYVGPAASEPPDISFLPPPYSEVANLPASYPGNKSDLPPYPGPPVIATSCTGTMPPPAALNAQDLNPVTTAMPKPPPYSEFAGASQNPVSPLAGSQAAAAAANQATDNIQQETSQSANQATDNIQENSQSANQCSAQPSTN